MATALDTAPPVTPVTIPTPQQIQAELDAMAERRKHLLRLLKVSNEVYQATK